MKNERLEKAVLKTIVAVIAIIIATLFRLFALKRGFDSFSANIIFLVVFVLLIVVYIVILLVLRSAFLPLLKQLLFIIPFVRNKWEHQQQAKLAREKKKSEQTDSEFTSDSEISSTQTINPLDILRKEHIQNEAKKKNELLEQALQYTRKTFAPFADDKAIDRLCHNVTLYATRANYDEFEPIRIHGLQNVDLYHFAWNIWHHFRNSTQDDAALFIKQVFSEALKDVESIDTIKKKFRLNEGKCMIELRDRL